MHIRYFKLSGRWFPVVLWAMAAYLAFCRFYLVALNITESLPGTVFLIEKDVMPQRGELVAFRWEANWPYPRGCIFVKKLVGLPGSVVSAQGREFFVDGAPVGRAKDHARTGDGQTALFMSLLAPEAGKPADDRCAVTLLQAGADSSLKHESGAMPIHLAAGSNYLIALQELLERRPQDVDAQTNIGITPLMMAATEGHVGAVKLLLKFGAVLTITDDDGLTAKDVAIKIGNDELATLLS